MKQNLNWFLLGMLVATIALLFLNKCEKQDIKKTENLDIKKVDSIKQKIDTVKVEVVKLKEAKTKIIYRTKFDTLATIDTVYAELQKCDTIVKIDSIIIQKQDTIIFKQEELIDAIEKNNDSLKKDIKKQKRKLLFTKILAGAIIVITIFATK